MNSIPDLYDGCREWAVVVAMLAVVIVGLLVVLLVTR